MITVNPRATQMGGTNLSTVINGYRYDQGAIVDKYLRCQDQAVIMDFGWNDTSITLVLNHMPFR
jgi:hypothetical protein